MEQLPRLLLPVYFLAYFGIAFVAKSVIVARRIGKNPLVLPKDDSAYGLIGRYFKWTLIAMFVYVLVFAFAPIFYDNFLKFNGIAPQWFAPAGWLLLAFALIWTIIAQRHMRDSWRIGIDTDTSTELVTTGLFKYSRNPIFFGMTLSLVGLFLVAPDGFTLLFLILGHVLMQVQIRLEEDFLASQHGETYRNYKQKVRRMI